MPSNRWWHYAGAARTWTVDCDGLCRRRFRVQWDPVIIQLQRLGGVEGLFLTGCFEYRIY